MRWLQRLLERFHPTRVESIVRPNSATVARLVAEWNAAQRQREERQAYDAWVVAVMDAFPADLDFRRPN